MVVVPDDKADTSPLLLTVATVLLVLVQFMDWFVALAGCMMAVRVCLFPIFIVRAFLSNDIAVTGIDCAVTVTIQVAVLFPSCVVTVMVAVPDVNAVTTPLLIEATDGLLLVHVTVLLVALEGEMVAISVSVEPETNDNVFLFRAMDVTGTVDSVLAIWSTFTCRDWLPAVTVNVAVRGETVGFSATKTVISLFPLPDAG